MKIKKEMTLLEFISAFKSNEHYKKHFSFSGLEVLYNYLLTLDEDIEFSAVVAQTLQNIYLYSLHFLLFFILINHDKHSSLVK
jgi:hypothetical protein